MELKTFAEEFEKWREQFDFTIYELAEVLEVSPTYVSQIGNGKRLPSKKLLFKLIYKILENDLKKEFTNSSDITDYKAPDVLGATHGLVNSFSKEKNIKLAPLVDELTDYIRTRLKEFIADQSFMGASIKSRNIKIDKVTGKYHEIEKPYFDLAWILRQEESEVMFGGDHLTDMISVSNDKLAASRLSEDDLTFIFKMIELYLDSKYAKPKNKMLSPEKSD